MNVVKHNIYFSPNIWEENISFAAVAIAMMMKEPKVEQRKKIPSFRVSQTAPTYERWMWKKRPKIPKKNIKDKEILIHATLNVCKH
jgi:hypothetical protein